MLIASPATVAGLIFGDALRTSAARRLPVPPVDPVGRVEFAILVVAIAADVVGAVLLWRDARRRDGARLLSAGVLLSVGGLPQALQRADEYHLVPAMVVPVALLAVSVPIVARWGGRHRLRLRARVIYALCLAAVLIAGARLEARQTPAVPVGNQGRSFPVAAGDAGEAQAVLSAVDRIARPGQRLFVGPMDMRRTNYTAAYLYFLLPQLVPATYYQEMEPLAANVPASHLAADVAGADVLVLTTKWDGWNEPNQSTSYYGPNLPNLAVARSFCLRATEGTFSVFTRCDARG